MSDSVILLVGLDRPEVAELHQRTTRELMACESLPRLMMQEGQLFANDRVRSPQFRPVSRVVFHGIFESDLPTLAALAMWGGPCLPSAHGMLDCRPRIPNLARCRRVSRFANLPRGYGDTGVTVSSEQPTVAKWGEWHCGEGKERFTGDWECTEPTLLEPFLEGEAVRVQLIGERVFQIRLGGADWKKSLHHSDSRLIPPDADLVEDTRRLQQHFRLEVCATDYIITPTGEKHLLELNHIPNVTEFPEMRAAYLDLVAAWINRE